MLQEFYKIINSSTSAKHVLKSNVDLLTAKAASDSEQLPIKENILHQAQRDMIENINRNYHLQEDSFQNSEPFEDYAIEDFEEPTANAYMEELAVSIYDMKNVKNAYF